MPSFALFSNLLALTLYAGLAALLACNWRRGLVGSLLLAAALVSAGWFGLQGAYYAGLLPVPLTTIRAVEVLRDGAWFALLVAIVAAARGRMPRRLAVLLGVAVAVELVLVTWPAAAARLAAWLGTRIEPALIGHLVLAVAGLALVELVYRNTRPERRWMVKLLCFGLGAVFAYDFFLYAHAVLFNRVVPAYWNARGAANALAVPLLALAAVRNPDWKADLFVSRQVVFHGTAVLLAGAYLIAMSAAGYYIQRFGGDWGPALQAVFLFGAVLVLVLVLVSQQARAWLRVFLAKHFYRNKYEYREQWLRFTRALAEAGGTRGDIERTVVCAVAAIMDSRWGYLWLRRGDAFRPVADCNAGPLPEGTEEPADSPLARLLASRGWVLELDEWREAPERYDGIAIPDWLEAMTQAWLVVPLLHRERLIGFMVLARPLAGRRVDWEDRDLLKTVAAQCAAHLALLEASEALAEARQFEAFNRLSAFVVHDLKNVTAQLALITANAARHRDNPAFIDDALETVDSAVKRLSRMLATLRAGRAEPPAARPLAVAELVAAVAAERAGARPVPQVDPVAADVAVMGDAEGLRNALAHLVQNAQEATPDDGEVRIAVTADDGTVRIEVRDTGCGMSERFVREELFRPFVTTKGNAGMGIGVYEARQIVERLGGTLEAASRPGVGTTFTLRLPRVAPLGERLAAAGGG